MVCVAFLLLIGELSAASSSAAQVIFEREVIDIAPPPEKNQQAAAQDDILSSQDKKPATRSKNKKKREIQRFTGEVRGEEALTLEYIHTLNNLTENTAVMIVLNSPSIVSLPAFNVYTPVDAAFIKNDGEIYQIFPSIVPAEINQDITAKIPVRAVIYFKAGLTKTLDIRPRDIVMHRAFNAKPIVIQ